MRGRRAVVTFGRVLARRRAVVLLALALLAACKEKSTPSAAPAPSTASGSPAPTTASGAAAPAAPKPPTLAPGSAAPAPAVQPLSDADVAAMLPKLDGDVLIAPKTTADARQAHATWCIAGSSATTVAANLATTMTAAGWQDLGSRGDAKKAGVSGERDGYRLSYVVSASSAASCREPTHYMVSATLFRMH
jgi:photosystem II stability/assembly factor-like uncharacterized protein